MNPTSVCKVQWRVLLPFYSSFPIFLDSFLLHEPHLCIYGWRVLLTFFSCFLIFFHSFLLHESHLCTVHWMVLLPFYSSFTIFLPFILLHEFPLCVCGPEEDSNLFLIKLVNFLPFIFPSWIPPLYEMSTEGLYSLYSLAVQFSSIHFFFMNPTSVWSVH